MIFRVLIINKILSAIISNILHCRLGYHVLYRSMHFRVFDFLHYHLYCCPLGIFLLLHCPPVFPFFTLPSGFSVSTIVLWDSHVLNCSLCFSFLTLSSGLHLIHIVLFNCDIFHFPGISIFDTVLYLSHILHCHVDFLFNFFLSIMYLTLSFGFSIFIHSFLFFMTYNILMASHFLHLPLSFAYPTLSYYCTLFYRFP